jgi:hypothetical protein
MRRLWEWIGDRRGAATLVCLCVAAVLACRSGLDYSDANGSWQQAVRLEEARSAVVQEQARMVYGDEAPAVVRIVLDERVAAGLAPLAGNDPAIEAQRAANVATASALRSAYTRLTPDVLAADRYRTWSGGADVIRRLRALRTTGEINADPDPLVEAGDASARRALLLAGLAALVSLIAAVLATTGKGWGSGLGRHRRLLDDRPELMPLPNLETEPWQWRVALGALVLWLLGVVVPLSQVVLGAEEQRSMATAARLTAVLTGDIAASTARTQFEAQARQVAFDLSLHAEARREHPARPGDLKVADVEDGAASHTGLIITEMVRPPVAADGLGARMTAAVASDPKQWPDQTAAEQAATARSVRWGNWANYFLIGIAVIVIAICFVEVVRFNLAISRSLGGGTGAGGETDAGFVESSIPIEIYVDTEDEHEARRVFVAADNLAYLLGYGDAFDESIERGSFWRNARARLRRGVESDEVTSRLIKLERAFELKHLDLQQADVDAKSADAASQLIASMENIPQGTMRVGSIFLVKYEEAGIPTIHIRSLSQLEIRALERYPEIQRKPQQALEALATATPSLEGVPE